MRQLTPSSKERGFSLIELMVALTILAGLIAAAGPSTVSWLRTSNTQNAAETVQSGLRRARAEAMQRHRPVTFWLVSLGPSGTFPDDGCSLSAKSASWVVSLDNPEKQCGGLPSYDAAPRMVGKAGVTLPQGIQVSAADRSGNEATSVTFGPQGWPVPGVSHVAKIDIVHPDNAVRPLRVQISSSGAIRLCEPVAGLPASDPKACRD